MRACISGTLVAVDQETRYLDGDNGNRTPMCNLTLIPEGEQETVRAFAMDEQVIAHLRKVAEKPFSEVRLQARISAKTPQRGGTAYLSLRVVAVTPVSAQPLRPAAGQ